MRKYHRWVSLVALFFILWVAITGLMLALDYLIPAVNGSPGWWNDMQTRIWLHNFLQELHRGTIFFGLPGHILGFLAGLSLVFLSVSGIQMYLSLLKRRKQSGQRGLFWKTGTGMRRYHRYISTLAMVFLFYVAVTGTLVSFVQFLDARAVAMVGGGGIAPELFGGPSAEERAVMEAAQPLVEPVGQQAAAPGAGTPPPAGPGAGGPGEPPDRGPIVALSTELQKWHKGNVVGEFGQWLVVGTGVLFFVLSITGAVMYWQMWRTRSKQGKKALFWQ